MHEEVRQACGKIVTVTRPSISKRVQSPYFSGHVETRLSDYQRKAALRAQFARVAFRFRNRILRCAGGGGLLFRGRRLPALAVNEDAPWLSQEASRCHSSRIIRSLGLLCGVELGQFYSVRGVPDSYDAVFSAGDDDRSVGVGCRAVNVV